VVTEGSIFCSVKDQRHIKFSFWSLDQDLQSRGIQEEVPEFWIGSIQSQDKIDLCFAKSLAQPRIHLDQSKVQKKNYRAGSARRTTDDLCGRARLGASLAHAFDR
jgi:hypothetical protein